MTKSTDPGRWDTLMGGQLAAGETIADALARETMEEAGLDLSDLRGLTPAPPLLLRRPVREGYMVERISVFRAIVPAGVVPINRDGEVDRFECLEPSALARRLAAGEFTLEATLILGAELERRAALARAPASERRPGARPRARARCATRRAARRALRSARRDRRRA